MSDDLHERNLGVAEVPEVVPPWKYHDGWAGATGAEIRYEPYTPYSHPWDQTIVFCRVAHALSRDGWNDVVTRPVHELDPRTVLRALPFVWSFEHWRRRQIDARAKQLLDWLDDIP